MFRPKMAISKEVFNKGKIVTNYVSIVKLYFYAVGGIKM